MVSQGVQKKQRASPPFVLSLSKDERPVLKA